MIDAIPKEDLILECAECGRKFVWTIGEQKFFKEKGISPPRTCSNYCRERRQIARRKSQMRRELNDAMQPSEPFRTGSSAGNAVHVSGGNASEISAWTLDNIRKGYTKGF